MECSGFEWHVLSSVIQEISQCPGLGGYKVYFNCTVSLSLALIQCVFCSELQHGWKALPAVWYGGVVSGSGICLHE